MNNPLLYILRRVMSYPLFRRGIGGGFFLFFISSCGDGERASFLRQAEAQLPEHPDSAQTLLNRVGNSFELSDDNRAWYGLLRTWTDNLLTSSVNSDTLLRDSYLYYNKVSEGGETSDSVLLRRYAQSCYLMGRYYISADSTKQAEDCLRRATVLADRAHDYRTTYLAYDHLSRQLIWSNQQEALNLSLKSLDYCLRYKDKPSNEIAVRTNVASNFALCGDSANAFQILKEAYQIAIKNHLLVQKYDVIRTYGKVYLAVGEYRKALSYSKKGLQHLTSSTEVNAKLQLANCYLYCDSISQTKKILLSLTKVQSTTDKYIYYWHLRDLAFSEQDYTSAKIYGDSAYSSYDKMFFDALELKDSYYHDVIQKEKQTEQLKYEKLEQHQRTIASIIIAVLLMAIGYLISRRRIKRLYRKRKRSVQQHRKDQKEYTLKVQELNSTLSDLADRIQQKEQDVQELQTFIAEKEAAYQRLIEQKNLDFKEQEMEKAAIAAKMESVEQELHLARQSLSENQRELSLMKASFKQKEEEHNRGMDILAKQAISQSSLFIKLVQPHTIQDKQARKVIDGDWKEAEKLLNTYYKDFAKRLKSQYPSLDEDGYRLCLMIKMGLTNKQRGEYFHILESAIQKRKGALKKTVFHIQDSAFHIDQFLADF